jgi:hypothetical protein
MAASSFAELSTFALIHTAITLVAIVAGLVMLAAMLRSDRAGLVSAIFWIFTVLTDITGFLLPYTTVTPAVIFGIVLAVLMIAGIAARYLFGLRGVWRPVYVVTAVLSLYMNCFVLVVQLFSKLAALHALAPGNPPAGPVFAAVQGVVLVAFIIAGYLGVRRFHPRG